MTKIKYIIKSKLIEKNQEILTVERNSTYTADGL